MAFWGVGDGIGASTGGSVLCVTVFFFLSELLCDDAGFLGVGGASEVDCSSFCFKLEEGELLSLERCDSFSFFFFLRKPRVGIRIVAESNTREGDKTDRPITRSLWIWSMFL